MNLKKNGFTLFEILLVIFLIATVFSIVLPFSINVYLNYKASLKAQKIMIFIGELRRKSFLYSKSYEIHSKDGELIVNNKPIYFKNAFIKVFSPIIFYKNGATNGGEIYITVNNINFILKILSPTGDLILEKAG